MFEFVDKFITPVIVAIVSAFVMLIRKVLVNEEAIKLLQQEARDREARRIEERELLKELKVDMKDMRQEIKDLYRHKS